MGKESQFIQAETNIHNKGFMALLDTRQTSCGCSFKQTPSNKNRMTVEKHLYHMLKSFSFFLPASFLPSVIKELACHRLQVGVLWF